MSNIIDSEIYDIKMQRNHKQRRNRSFHHRLFRNEENEGLPLYLVYFFNKTFFICLLYPPSKQMARNVKLEGT